MVPVTSAFLSPAYLLPAAGLSPTSPVIAEVGTSVTAVPARTANGAAVCSCTGVVAEATPGNAVERSTAVSKVAPATDVRVARRRRPDRWRRVTAGANGRSRVVRFGRIADSFWHIRNN